MKKSFYILSAFLCALAFAACSDDTDNPYAQENVITVVESDVYFPAKASQGTITFEAEGTATVKAKSDWCTASLSGNTVNVSVTSNASIQNRSTMVTIYCGTDSVNVPVTQSGAIFKFGGGASITVNDAEQTVTYAYSSNADVNFTDLPDWVTVRMTSDSIYITVSQNSTGHIRYGELKYEYAGLSESINLSQGEGKDLEGTYYFAGTSASTGSVSYITCTIEEENGTLTLSFPSFGWTMDVTLEDGFYFDLPAGTYLGKYGNYYVGIVLWDTNLGYITWASSRSYRCQFAWDEESGTYAEFSDNGSWSGYEISCIRFEAFSSSTFSSSTRKGYLLALINPFLLKMESE